ncbi:MAG TPA: insulinase family protein, partial [Oceanospirillaceae bacterium]|nr:insulinase family protein [Oceanospirillaceae bacterium]
MLIGCAGLSSKEQQGPVQKYYLDNGLEVILWANSNSHSNDEVELDLVIHTGSLQETDDQLGYAHLVEHMLFEQVAEDGSHPVKDVLTSLDLKLGQHANAYTTYDHTNYYLKVIGAEQQRLHSALKLLSSFAFKSEFVEAEVAQEIGVVREEWRLREPEAHRAQYKLRQLDLAGSRYYERPPIGTLASIQAAQATSLNTFYKDHYRPANASLIISGDFNLEKMRQRVELEFSQWPSKDLGRAQQYPAPALDNTSTHMLTDPLQDNYWLALMREESEATVNNAVNWLDTMKHDAVLEILWQRLEKRRFKASGGVRSFSAGMDHPYGNMMRYYVSLEASLDSLPEAVRLLAQERHRIATFGVSKIELDAWRDAMLINEQPQQDSAWHLAEIAVDHVVYGTWLRGQQEYLATLEAQLPLLTSADINTAAADMFASDLKVELVAPNTQTLPSPADLSQWLFEESVDDGFAVQLLSLQTWPVNAALGQIIQQQTLANGVTVFELSNGITVQHRYSASAPGKVYMHLVGQGGLNQLLGRDAINARLSLQTMTASGLGALDGPALSQWLEQRGIVLQPYYTYFTREMQLASPSEDVDLSLRLMHYALTQGRVSNSVLDYYKQQNLDVIVEMQGSVLDPYHRDIEAVFSGTDPSLRRLTVDEINVTQASQMLALYNRHYKGAQNYVLSIVGDIQAHELEQTLAANVASLPLTANPPAGFRSAPVLREPLQISGQGSNEKSTQVVLLYQIPKSVVAQ